MASYNLRTVLKMMGQNILNWVKSNCVNNLLSTSTSLPLAAAQGKVLDEKIDNINQSLVNNYQTKLTNPLTKSDVVNNLTTTTTNVPLSAAQGKILNDNMKSIGDIELIGALTATSGVIALTQPLTNFREVLFCVNLTGVGVVASSQVAVDYFINYMNMATSRHIVGTYLDKLYEADFYYASGQITMLNGTNLSGVSIFGIK